MKYDLYIQQVIKQYDINLLALTDNDTKNYVLCECFNINKKLTYYIRRTIEQDGITKDFIYSTPDTNTWKIYENCIAEKPTALIGTNNRGA